MSLGYKLPLSDVLQIKNCESQFFEKNFSKNKGWEEGGDDARSACPSDALGRTRDTMATTTGCDEETPSQSLEKWPKFGLRSATRPHEAGIASNRRSAHCGEYVLKSCTHRPSR